jgi:hypothetical protein
MIDLLRAIVWRARRARNMWCCVAKMTPSRWLGQLSARAASTNAMRDTADASGDLPPAGDQSPNFNAVPQAGERCWFAGNRLSSGKSKLHGH